VRIPGLLSASRQYVRTHHQPAMYPILSNAIKHLRAALDLREEIVEGRTREGLFQFGFVTYKALLRFGSNIGFFPTSSDLTKIA